jgi:hypothetical protein
VLQGPRPTILRRRSHRARNATIVDRRVILLIHTPTHIHVLLYHRKPRQHHRQLVLELYSSPSSTELRSREGESNGYGRSLERCNHGALYISRQIYSVLINLCDLFFSGPENLGTRFLLRGVVLSHPKISNFGM